MSKNLYINNEWQKQLTTLSRINVEEKKNLFVLENNSFFLANDQTYYKKMFPFRSPEKWNIKINH